MTTTEHEEELFEEECVCCDEPLGERGDHINWVYTSYKAEWDYPVAGNVAYDIPSEYAMALVCDVCLEEDRDVEYVLKGEDLERVPIDELEEIPTMEERIFEQLDDEFVDDVHAGLEELFEDLRGEWIAKWEALNWIRFHLDERPDDVALAIDALVRDDRVKERDTDEVLQIALE